MDVITNFKRLDQQHFPTRQQKKVIISGVADGNPFTIEADYQRDQEMLSINNEKVSLPAFRPYEYIWQKVLLSDNKKASHIIANEHLARRAYQISALLWHASFTEQEVLIDSNKTLSQVTLSYRDALEAGQLPFYQHNQKREWVEKHLIDPVIDTAEGLRMRLTRPSPRHK